MSLHLRPWPPLYAPGDLAKGTLLVVAPHPDDEVIGPGGLVAAHRDAGVRVVTVVMTDGRGANGKDDYVALRKDESRAASEVLGGTELRFFDFADGGLAERLTDETSGGPIRRLADLIVDVEPATIVFPSPYEVHPDHRAAAIITLQATRYLIGQEVSSGADSAGSTFDSRSLRLLAYEVGEMIPCNLLINTTWLFERKCLALRKFESQLGAHDLEGKMEALNRARTVNCDDKTVRYCEAYLRVDPSKIDVFRRQVDDVVACTDAMAPSLPYD